MLFLQNRFESKVVISSIPTVNFLGFPNASEYKDCCFRQYSATFVANSGVNILTLRKYAGWYSTSFRERYTDNSRKRQKLSTK